MKRLAVWFVLAACLVPASARAGISTDWWVDLSTDGSTNYIPVAVSPADDALTLTLTAWPPATWSVHPAVSFP